LNILDVADSQKLLPAYLRVAREIQQRLATMKVGDQLSPERQLCTELGVSRVTLRRALGYFHEKGILEARGSGGTRLALEVSSLPPTRMATNRLIGLVIPSVQFTHISRIVQGAEQFATDSGYHLTVAHDHNDSDVQIKQLRRMLDSGVGGLAVYPDARNNERKEFTSLIRRIRQLNVPLVMMDRYLPDIDTPSVLSDNFQGMYMATEHMILAGYRRIGLLSLGPEAAVSERDRRRGFLAALKDYELEPKPVFEAVAGVIRNEEVAQRIMTEYLQKNRSKLSFDGLVCMQCNIAYGAFLALRNAGVSVPSEVGLVGYDKLDETLGRAIGLDLTSIDQPLEKIGYETVRLLIDEIEGRKKRGAAQHLLLKPTLVLGTSCGTRIAPSAITGPADPLYASA
jgi:DNA-binding LacI/PurR family transcriptional regulator